MDAVFRNPKAIEFKHFFAENLLHNLRNAPRPLLAFLQRVYWVVLKKLELDKMCAHNHWYVSSFCLEKSRRNKQKQQQYRNPPTTMPLNHLRNVTSSFDVCIRDGPARSNRGRYPRYAVHNNTRGAQTIYEWPIKFEFKLVGYITDLIWEPVGS